MRGRVLNEQMVAWIAHLLHDTTWEPDRQAAADLLATIEYLIATEGELPDEPLVPPGLAVPQALDAQGEPVAKAAGKAARSAKGKRPMLTLVPPVPTKSDGDEESPV